MEIFRDRRIWLPGGCQRQEIAGPPEGFGSDGYDIDGEFLARVSVAPALPPDATGREAGETGEAGQPAVEKHPMRR